MSREMCQPAERLNTVTDFNGEQTGESAASASSGGAARPQSTAATQSLSEKRDICRSEPVQQASANGQLDHLERNLDRIFEKQLEKFEHKLSSICDVALARLQEHMNEAMQSWDPDKWKSVSRA